MSEKTTAAELRGQTAEELEQFIGDKQDELFKLRLQHYTGQLEDSAALGRARRALGRALTVQRERFGEALPAMESKLSEASFAFYSEQTQAGADALAAARSEFVKALTDKGQPAQAAPSVRVRRRALGQAGAIVAQAKEKAEKAQEAARLAANRAAAKAAKELKAQRKAERKAKEMQA